MKKKGFRNITAIAGGLLIGLVNGFFGGGGGMLAVPLLNKPLGLNTKQSHATAILVILPITIVSSIAYIIKGYFALNQTLFVGSGVIIGGIIGALLLKIIPAKIVGFVFAILMITAGIKLVFF